MGIDESKWKNIISIYDLLNLGDIYQVVHLKLGVNRNKLAKLFYLKAGANPKGIKVKMKGSKV